MHDVRYRQLLAHARVALLVAVAVVAAQAFAEAPSGPTAAQELQAAKLIEASLAARQAGPEEWQKLDRIYEDLIAKYPRDASVRNGRAEFLWDISEHERAVSDWEAAVEIDPKNGRGLQHLAEAYLAAGDAKKSAGFYTRACEAEPGNASFHFAAGNVFFLFRHELRDAARPNEESVIRTALFHFAEAARLAPLDAEYARAYAETFYGVPKADWRAAIAAWEHFFEISPQKDFALVNLARTHLKLGQKDAARTCLDQIQSPEFERIKAKLREQIERPPDALPAP